MQRVSRVTTVFCAGVIGVMMLANARADEWNKKSAITFSGPVEIPGIHLTGWGVLPAGTYIFKIMDSQSDRHIVQIFNKDETIVYATALAIPNFRLQATGKTAITFSERPAGQPEALRAWFYPGTNWGEEFVYPKAKAIELAKETHMAVLFTPMDLKLEMPEPIQPNAPVIAELKQAPVLAIQPSGEEVQLAQVVTSPPAMGETTEKALPATASAWPMIALFGVLALCGAFVVRRNSQRSVVSRASELPRSQRPL